MIPILKQFGGGRTPEYLTLERFDARGYVGDIVRGVPASPYLPLISIKLLTTGRLQDATGSTRPFLVYSDRDPDFLVGGEDASLYEAKLTQNSQTGAAGTIFGSLVGSFVTLDTNAVWTFQKDSSNVGVASWNIDLEIREIADTGNTVSVTGKTVQAEVTL